MRFTSKTISSLTGFSFILLLLSGCNPVEHLKGDKTLSALEEVDEVFVEFDYSKTTVGGDEQSEEDFIAEKVKEKNEGEEGAGDEWEKQWRNDKKNVFEPNFKETLRGYLTDVGTDISDEASDADVTLVVRIDRIEPGFYGGVVEKDAELDSKMLLVEGDDKGSPKSVLKLYDVDGPNGSFNKSTTRRLKNAYQASARFYGRYIKGKVEE